MVNIGDVSSFFPSLSPIFWLAQILQRADLGDEPEHPLEVGELEPELYFLAVRGQFYDLVIRTKNRLRASRAPSGGAPGRAQPVAFAQRARRCLARPVRGAGKGRCKCT